MIRRLAEAIKVPGSSPRDWSRHHRNEGLNRLAAVRVTRWYDQLDADQLVELQRLLGLPSRGDQLAEVIPPEPAELLATAYTAQIEEIAPASLQDREEELAELAGFCASDAFYAWWQAPPWAGKTALMSWFATHPPVNVDVVSARPLGRAGAAERARPSGRGDTRMPTGRSRVALKGWVSHPLLVWVIITQPDVPVCVIVHIAKLDGHRFTCDVGRSLTQNDTLRSDYEWSEDMRKMAMRASIVTASALPSDLGAIAAAPMAQAAAAANSHLAPRAYSAPR